LDSFLGASTAVIAGVRIKERQLIMVLTDSMEIQVGDMTKALGEEDTLWETAMWALGWGTLPRVKR
jgi:hypothetical protein